MAMREVSSDAAHSLLRMGFSSAAIKLAYEKVQSDDLDELLEWILTHTDEISTVEGTESITRELMELGFSRSLTQLAQEKTHSNDIETLTNWLLDHSAPKEAQMREKLKNDLFKRGFDHEDVEACLVQLNIPGTTKFDLTSKRTECIDWLIASIQKKAQIKAKEIRRRQKQIRVPPSIKLSDCKRNHSSPPIPSQITNDYLKQVHLSSRYGNTDINQQPSSSALTEEEAIMEGIHENLERQTWTVPIFDQLDLIQANIRTVARVIQEDRHQIPPHREAQVRPVSRLANRQEKKIFTLADLSSENRCHASPRKNYIPGATEEADWDSTALTAADQIALNLDYRSGENYRQLADRLLRECHVSPRDHLSVVRAIFVWITNHIRYDIRMSPRDNSQKKQMDELCRLILQTQYCVCVGYAVLFKRMCEHFDIRVDYVSGYTKRTKACINDVTSEEAISKLSGHAWTMVHLNGKAFFTDPTWSAAHWSSDGKSPFTNAYYLVLPEHAIYQFRPHQDGDQHLASPWSIPKFIQEPCLYPHFFRSEFVLDEKETEWSCYRLSVDRNQRRAMTKTFRITTKKHEQSRKYPWLMLGTLYWRKHIHELDDDSDSRDNQNFEHELSSVEFKQIDMTLADKNLNDPSPLFIAELKDIPIHPPKLNVYDINYGLLRIWTTDSCTGRYECIFECIFEFQ